MTTKARPTPRTMTAATPRARRERGTDLTARLMCEFVWCGGILYQRITLWQEMQMNCPHAREPFGPAYVAFHPEALDTSGESVELPRRLLVAVAINDHRSLSAQEAVDWIEAHEWRP